MPLLRYVDDYFSADRERAAEHSMKVFARYQSLARFARVYSCDCLLHRLVKLCLGSTAISARKLCFGNPLPILGVRIELLKEGAAFWPDPVKVEKWMKRILIALLGEKLRAGDASKLLGYLQFATQRAFKRLGRAMLWAIIR